MPKTAPKTVPLLFAPAIMQGLLRAEYPKTMTTRLDRGQKLPEVGREMWSKEKFTADYTVNYMADAMDPDMLEVRYIAPCPPRLVKNAAGYEPPRVCRSGAFASPLIMPRFLSRYAAPLTEVRRERLQDITEGDAQREGLPGYQDTHGWRWEGPQRREPNAARVTPEFERARDAFAAWWDHLHPADPWESNPMVIRYGWRREDAEVWNG